MNSAIISIKASVKFFFFGKGWKNRSQRAIAGLLMSRAYHHSSKPEFRKLLLLPPQLAVVLMKLVWVDPNLEFSHHNSQVSLTRSRKIAFVSLLPTRMKRNPSDRQNSICFQNTNCKMIWEVWVLALQFLQIEYGKGIERSSHDIYHKQPRPLWP